MEFQVSTSGATFHQRGHQSVRRFWTFPLDWWRCIDMHQLLLQLWFAFGHLSCHPCLLALFSFYHWQPVWLLFLVLSTTDWLRNHHTSQVGPVPNEPLKGHLRSSDKNKGHLTSGSIDKLSLVLSLVQLEFSFDQIQWKWHWNTIDTSQSAISYLKFKIVICT